MQYLPSLFVIHTQRLTHTYRQLRASKSYNRFEEEVLQYICLEVTQFCMLIFNFMHV